MQAITDHQETALAALAALLLILAALVYRGLFIAGRRLAIPLTLPNVPTQARRPA